MLDPALEIGCRLLVLEPEYHEIVQAFEPTTRDEVAGPCARSAPPVQLVELLAEAPRRHFDLDAEWIVAFGDAVGHFAFAPHHGER